MIRLQYVLHFCWAAHKKLVPTLNYSLGTLSSKIVALADTTHRRCVMPMPVSMPSGLGASDAMMQDITSYL
jgi:hypothetical protein